MGRLPLGRGAAALSLAVLLELVLVSYGSTSREDVRLGYPLGGDPVKEYVFEVLSEHRTGLDRAQELRLAGVIVNESRESGLDPFFVMALIETESTFYNWARSEKGAIGLMQVRPLTGRYLAEELEMGWEGEKTLYDPYQNVRLGIRYLSHLVGRYGSEATALAAYSSGPSLVSSRLRRGEPLPRRYGEKVFTRYTLMRKGVGEGAED